METTEHSLMQKKDFLKQCLKSLPQIRAQLGRLVPETEQDFLELGAQLHEIAAQATAFSEEAGELSAKTSGEALTQFSQGLDQELIKMDQLFNSAINQRNMDELLLVLEDANSLQVHIQEFRRIVRTLQMLGMSTRIESARLGSDGSGFSTLADDVESLANNIVTYSSQVLEKSVLLGTLAGEAKSQTDTMQCSQGDCSETVFSSIRENLEKLHKLSDNSREMSQDIIQTSSETNTSIGEVVSSLQFHDITRQQVEHVEEALDDVVNVLGENIVQDEDQVNDYVGWAADVCALQVSQLDNAKERFVDAINILKENLLRVGDAILEAGNHVQAMAGAQGDERVLNIIEASISDVVQTISSFGLQGESIAKNMVAVVATVEEIGKHLADIEEVGSEIELIALNASIKAAHTGEKGKALGVLASSVQHLSVEARTLTESVTGLLKKISTSADTLSANAEELSDTSLMDETVHSLEELTAGLMVVDKEVMDEFAVINKAGTSLGSRIHTLCSRISFHQQVGKGLDTGRASLQKVEADARVLLPEHLDENRPERLKQMLERYTMEMERIVHETAFNQGAGGNGEAVSASTMGAGEGEAELWDNVELF